MARLDKAAYVSDGGDPGVAGEVWDSRDSGVWDVAAAAPLQHKDAHVNVCGQCFEL